VRYLKKKLSVKACTLNDIPRQIWELNKFEKTLKISMLIIWAPKNSS